MPAPVHKDQATELDGLRGFTSGRLPVASAPDGERSFVLGSQDRATMHWVSDGDYTEVRQTANLDDIDLVCATFDMAGAAVEQAVVPPCLEADEHTLLFFPMDEDTAGAGNAVKNRLRLLARGGITVGTETYSGVGTPCKAIPQDTTDGRLVGTNTPQAFPELLPQYDVDFWLKFDVGGRDSPGVSPEVFACDTPGVGGLRLYLDGLSGPPGTQSWSLAVDHRNGTMVETCVLTSHAITADTGWVCYKLTFTATDLRLYANGVQVATGTISTEPAQPEEGETVYVADPQLWGEIDQIRMRSNFSGSTPAEDYAAQVGGNRIYNFRWRMSIRVDDVEIVSRVIDPTEEMRLADFRAPVGRYTGIHDVAFRLALEEV